MVSEDLTDDRYAQQRSTQLARQTNLRKVEGKAIAYSERGYSHSGMAKAMDTSESTVSGYMERAIAEYGFEIAETHVTEGQPPDYDRVDPVYFTSRSRTDQKEWVNLVRKNEDKLPAEWVAQVEHEAKREGVFPPVDE